MLVREINEVSSLTWADWVEIEATLLAGDDAKYSCEKCLSRYKGQAGGEMRTEESRKSKACQEVRADPFVFGSDRKLGFKTCPGNFVSPSVYPLLEMQAKYDQGVMPFPGALSDQPAKIIEAFHVIAQNRFKKAEADRKRAQMNQRASRGSSGSR